MAVKQSKNRNNVPASGDKYEPSKSGEKRLGRACSTPTRNMKKHMLGQIYIQSSRPVFATKAASALTKGSVRRVLGILGLASEWQLVDSHTLSMKL